MESTRQQKVSRLLQKELGNVFSITGRTLFNGALITVTKVRVTPDLSIARVYLSIYSVANKNSMFEDIQKQSKTIHHRLVELISKQLRIMPVLEFHIDDSLDYQENIEKLLKTE
jgi:ribosome-binding factor A